MRIFAFVFVVLFPASGFFAFSPILPAHPPLLAAVRDCGPGFRGRSHLPADGRLSLPVAAGLPRRRLSAGPVAAFCAFAALGIATTSRRSRTLVAMAADDSQEAATAQRGVLWDLDGTLVESTKLAFDATNEVLRKAGVGEVTLESYKFGCRYTTPERFNFHLGVPEGNPEGAELGRVFDETYVARVSRDTAAFFPGVEGVVGILALEGYPQGVLSNACGAYVAAVAAAHGLQEEVAGPERREAGVFGVLRGADQVPAAKPAPGGLLACCDALGVAPELCVYVGDSPSDGKAARRAGMRGVGVLWGANDAAALQDHFDVLVEDAASLRLALREVLARRPPAKLSGPVTFVTGNAKKLAETRRIVGDDLPLEAKALELPELQGEPEKVAAIKAEEAFKRIGKPVLVEDTSLCFNALQGLPGVYIKWFLEKLGHDGLNKMLVGFDDKTAYAQCIFAYCDEVGETSVFVGRTSGRIVPARGDNAFGWDPVFQPDESGGLTYAEMTPAAKDAISHRGRALQKVREFFGVA